VARSAKKSAVTVRAKSKKKQPIREDGAQTRQQLLEVAGQVFAEQGYARATSKEICERAKANIAAVNYHFGGKDGLYAAVLEEAHARLVSIDLVAAAVKDQNDPAAGLRMFLSRIVGEIARRDEGAWELRVLSREILSPTPMMDRMLSTQVAPKAKLVSGMIGRMLGVPATHPAVSRSIVSLMGPCIMLLMISEDVIGKVFPSLTLDGDALSEHLVTFALGGIKAIAAKEKK
jgi:TetR/AcrR family transcriptional regulator, regulator of cefoperazone and chloramphenicol sensitivity